MSVHDGEYFSLAIKKNSLEFLLRVLMPAEMWSLYVSDLCSGFTLSLTHCIVRKPRQITTANTAAMCTIS